MNVFRQFKMHLTRNFFNSSNSALKVKENREKFLNMSKAEKRKHYSCKDKYVTLDEIPTWTEYFKKANLDEKKSKRLKKNVFFKL
jgi:hypothetical protein